MTVVSLRWTGLRRLLQAYFTPSQGVAYVFSPFITPGLLSELLVAQGPRQAIVLTSWKPAHLLSGVSSLDTYSVCRIHGWHLYTNDRLHMKLYSHDLADAWVGSANVTGAALDDDVASNHEVLCQTSLDRDDRVHIHRLLARSCLVDDGIHAAYQTWLHVTGSAPSGTTRRPVLPARETDFLTTQLPHCVSPRRLWLLANQQLPPSDLAEAHAMEHDLALFDVVHTVPFGQYRSELATAFFKAPFVTALASDIDQEGLYFGRIKAWVQTRCTDVPTPFRRELTSVVQNLLRWFVELSPTEFAVDTPGRRSERLFRREDSEHGT